RRRHTRCLSDWSSDVCSSDLGKLYVIATSVANPRGEIRGQIVPGNIVVTFSRLDRTPEVAALGLAAGGVAATTVDTSANTLTIRSEERRVGKECASWVERERL